MDYFTALKAFVRAVELGSFSRAAEEQEAKVSTISRYVSALEADVGAALLNRSTRRLHLTEAGTALYGRAVSILADLDDARQFTKDLNSRPQGLLRVTMPAGFGRHHIIPHLPAFLALYPDIRMDLVLEDRVVDLIEAGLDVAIRIGVLGDSSLVGRRLAPHERVPVASPAYLDRLGAIREPDDLVRAECLISASQPGTGWYCRRADAPQGEPRAVPVSGRLRINESDALLRAAIDGMGIALLPRWAVAEAIGRGELVALLPEWLWDLSAGEPSSIWGVYPPKKVVSPKVRAFLDFVARHLAEENGWR
ncbi:LysR family transcriptional regulator [Sphingomonas sp. AP4-R1]|uniref:LysR family transcriptional regulator n=1 Tax=Sphingomonas sp. AP4-R1 TaxID=2735134 RepID=UPI001493AA3C|nr:LysR family transcriptional regulator [Sphingomonas sp. AP4-R1]QJU59173.1 LysR family transcriptional regulator [Sphingomonas sp. AP4-R1]